MFERLLHKPLSAIKRKARIDAGDLKGLKEFMQDYPEAKAYIIYGGAVRQYLGDVIALPFEEALPVLPELLKKGGS